MKIVAMYLPQFHRVEENDRWWGKGFTEWTTVKKATPLYEKHYQPRVPYNKEYYDLSDCNTIKKQADLMKKYGIDGMCFYHYWFENGRKILEKPAENLLKRKEIDMPFCFAWANETWARTWSNIPETNSWARSFEKEGSNQCNGVLLNQKYGNEEAWEKHFNYLLQFFKDERYIKIDRKPLFMIYKVCDIECLENMLDLWQQLAINNGFGGIYIVGNQARTSQIEALDEVFASEPAYSMRKCYSKLKNGIRCYDYDDVWRKILDEDFENNLIGAFVGYDDTPRHGNKGCIIENATPKKFEEYLSEWISFNKKYGKEIVFINAWNEWGEGMYLEPDEKYSFAYLNAVKEAKKCKYVTYENTNIEKGKIENRYSICEEKDKIFRRIFDKWLEIIEEEGSIINVLNKIENKKMAIYGYGILGRHLVKQMELLGYRPEFIIDNNVNIHSDYHIYGMEDEWPEVNVIIVTVVNEYGVIYRLVRSKNKYVDIVSLGHLIMDYTERLE